MTTNDSGNTQKTGTEGLEAIIKLMLSGNTLADIADISDEELEAVYACAYRLYQQGQYAEALRAFQFLIRYNHFERRFFKAAGACLQMLKRYPTALEMYYMTWYLDASDAEPLFYASECLIAMGQLDLAEESLEIVINHYAKRGVEHPLAVKSQAMLTLLRQARPKPATQEA